MFKFVSFCSLTAVLYIIANIVTVSVAQRRKGSVRQGNNGFDSNVFGKPVEVKCSNRTNQRLDTYAHQLLAGRFPTNGRELRQFCNQNIKGIGFVLGFAKSCLTEFAKKAFQVVFHPLSNEISLICKSGRMTNKAKELVKAGRCGNSARPGLRKCYHKFIDRQMAIHHYNENKKKIPMVCCEFHVLRECFKTEAEEVKSCSKKSIDFVERYALELFGEILNLMCYDYQDSSDRCDKVLREVPQIDFEGVKKPKSFVPPLLTILEDIGDEF